MQQLQQAQLLLQACRECRMAKCCIQHRPSALGAWFATPAVLLSARILVFRFVLLHILTWPHVKPT